MKLLKSKQKQLTPEGAIQQANSKIEAQKSQFQKMIEEVQRAMSLRSDAIEELAKEADSLKHTLERKEKEIEFALDQNKADTAYADRIQQFIG